MTRDDAHPPRLAVRLLELTAPDADIEYMLGDLQEEFALRRTRSAAAARRWCWLQVLLSTPTNLRRRHAETTAWLKAHPSEHRGDDTMTSFLHDLRFAWRSVARNKRLAATIVATLALGIATTTVIFSVIDGVVLNPFPFPEPERLVGVGSAFPKLQQEVSFWENLSPAEYVDLREGSRTLTSMVAWDMGNRQITEGGSTENAFSAFWWGDALKTLGVQATVGRGFTEDEVKAGKKVALVSHRFWTNRMGADPNRVGATLIVNGEAYTLVGVLPRRALIYGTDLWLTMPVGPEATREAVVNSRSSPVLAPASPSKTPTPSFNCWRRAPTRSSARASPSTRSGGWKRRPSSTSTSVSCARPRPSFSSRLSSSSPSPA